MALDLIIIIIVAGYMRKTFGNEGGTSAVWRQRFRAFIWSSIALMAVSIFVPDTPFIVWVSKAGLALLMYLIIARPAFHSARVFVTAILPYLLISATELFIKQIAPAFHKEWSSLWETASVFAVLWGVGVWIVTSRQRRELARTRREMQDQQEKNRMMAEMKDELEKQVKDRTSKILHQKNELENALTELRATQSQLVHAEKMASLGELTAGIAHEIQNPLNFVNNFAEVNMELVEELKEEITRGNVTEALDLAANIKDNESKIVHHGRRADGIVKGMLQHARKSSGEKEPVDLNALCDEYLRLAYHGLRARDKTFNATMTTDFDTALSADDDGNGRVNLPGQEVGRVVLNILTNAFYAVHRLNKDLMQSGGGPEYTPTVSIGTRKLPKWVEVTITDNGGGIPTDSLEKIFQPFFTTKPSGEGTGLGLSISYEIIVKGHHGELDVITKNRDGIFHTSSGAIEQIAPADEPDFLKSFISGTRFTILIPLN